MKIAFYSDTVFTFGGVQRVLAEVAKSLAERHEVTILSLDRGADLQMYDYARSRVHFKYLDYPPLGGCQQVIRKVYSLMYKRVLPACDLTSSLYARSFFPEPYKRRLADAIQEGEYQVVIGVHAFLSLHLASIRERIPCRVIGWMHNSYEAFFEKDTAYLPRLKAFFRYAIPRLDDFVVLCQADEARYAREMRLHPKVIYNPLTVRPLPVDLTQRTVHHRMLAVGRFSHRHKGFDILLKAFALFVKRHPEWTLELVGEGPERPLYEQIIRENRMEGNVDLRPFTRQIEARYAAADFYVLSSRWEGLPLVLIEAMAHGLPIVASRLPVTEELLEGHGVGLLCPSEDITALAETLEQMVRDERWLDMRNTAREYAEQFTVPQVIRQWEALFPTDGPRGMDV
jgi:glycosyltransferase involved in cell wall biosynthesis